MKRIYLATMILWTLMSCQQPSQETAPVEQKSNKEIVVENIMARRSIRSYKPEQVKEEELNEIITCAINAPSAMNKQSWEVRVIQKPELLQAINDGFKAFGKTQNSVFYNAPTLIVVASQKDNPYSAVDCGLLGENILLSAESMGLGTCVIAGVIQFLNAPEAKDIVAQLNLPEGFTPLYTIALGYKNEQPEAKPRDAVKVQVIK